VNQRRLPTDEERLQSLSRLARRVTDVDQERSSVGGARWENLRVAMEGGAQRPRVSPRWWRAAACVTAAAVLVGVAGSWWWGRVGTRLTYTLQGASLEGEGYIAGIKADSAALTFSDGTAISLQQGCRARVVSTDERGARVRLEDGQAHFAVVHRPRARWAIEAGPFTVQVIGTTFDVRWSGGDDLLEVRLLRGRVDVHGPLTGGGVTLKEGERFQARVSQGVMRIERMEPAQAARRPAGSAAPPSVAATEAPAKAEPQAVPAVQPTPAPAPAPARRPGWSPARRVVARAGVATIENVGVTWRQRVASGDFRGVLDEAEQQGIEACLRQLPVERLATLGDAARYAGQIGLARQVLLAQRTRFPDEIATRGTAFLLGRLAEESGEPAQISIGWYRTYLAEAPHGAYAAEALGRLMLALRQLPDAVAARTAADHYLAQFPDGAHAGPARAILQGSR